MLHARLGATTRIRAGDHSLCPVQFLISRAKVMQTAKNETNLQVLPEAQIPALLSALPAWGDVVTIVFSGGCVFEFKGPFPPGKESKGYFNLQGTLPGMHGHLRLSNLVRVSFQEKPHRGRPSYALVFETDSGECVFKVFLGRNAQGEILAEQLQAFKRLQSTLNVESRKTL
ncbi:MAG: heme utilization cystosolic carrier protein HutX [bacterium]